MEKKTFAIIFVISFIFLTYYLWQNNDNVAQIIIKDGLRGVLWYFLSNANYVLILISIMILETNVNYLRRLMGGVLTIFAFDIVSMPRMVSTSLADNGIAILASMDGITITKLVNMGVSYGNAHTFYYLVLPIILIFISFNLLGIIEFYKKVMGS